MQHTDLVIFMRRGTYPNLVACTERGREAMFANTGVRTHSCDLVCTPEEFTDEIAGDGLTVEIVNNQH